MSFNPNKASNTLLQEFPSSIHGTKANLDRSVADLVCFSHLRWNFVYQRPQHLLSRAAADRRVFFVEEPEFDDGSMRLEVNRQSCGVNVVVPHLPNGLKSSVAIQA